MLSIRNKAACSQKTILEARRNEMAKLLSQPRASEYIIKRTLTAIKTFEEAFNSLDIHQQKAQLQTILKAANIFKDGKIKLEFRG
jgi:hypothetical protein